MPAMKYHRIQDLIGLKVHSIRGTKPRKNAKTIKPEVILFNDGETYILLEDQDYYTYHDCSYSAKEIQILQHKALWESFLGPIYADATEDL